MSMISAQIDELRRYADRADGTFPMLASALRDAADTIQQLRDDLQRANGRLADAEHDESRAWDRVRKAEAEADRLRSCLSDDADNARQIMGENAKLRELVRIAGTYCVNGLCGKDDGCPLYLGKPCCALNDRMRELGIEVDG